MAYEVRLGSPLSYIGVFYPTAQNSKDFQTWQTSVNDLNMILANHDNFKRGEEEQDPTFARKTLDFSNRFGSNAALIWDITYAWERAVARGTETWVELYDAMAELQAQIQGLDISDAQKYQLWRQLNIGGFVADEPIARKNVVQNQLGKILDKISALDTCFSAFGADWWLPTPRRLIALHRHNNTGDWLDIGGGDNYFLSIVDSLKAIGVNLWGMDTYIQDDAQNPTLIRQDRQFFYDTLTSRGLEIPGTDFMSMIGRAFSNPAYPRWLDQTQNHYYFDCATEYYGGIEWDRQFHSLFWWEYYTDEESPDESIGYDSHQPTKGYVEDISGENF